MYSRHTASGGYMMTRQGAAIGLAYAGRISVPIDHFLFNDTISPIWWKMRPHLVTPAVVRQADTGESDIWTHGEASPPRSVRRRMRLSRGLAEVSGLPRQLTALIGGRAVLLEHVFRE